MGSHHDSGPPMPAAVESSPDVAVHKFPGHTRQISLRNTGPNTLWVSFEEGVWHDVASGTSWDDRVNENGFKHCTQTGRTSFVVVGIKLNL